MLINFDANFDIPYDLIKEKFETWKLRNEIILTPILLGTPSVVPLFPNSKTNDKMFIGFTAIAIFDEADYFQVVTPRTSYFCIENSGNTMFPKNVLSKITPGPPALLPYDIPASLHICGVYTVAGAGAAQMSGCAKVRLDEIIHGSENIVLHVDTDSAVTAYFYLYSVYVEGKLK